MCGVETMVRVGGFGGLGGGAGGDRLGALEGNQMHCVTHHCRDREEEEEGRRWRRRSRRRTASARPARARVIGRQGG